MREADGGRPTWFSLFGVGLAVALGFGALTVVVAVLFFLNTVLLFRLLD